MKIYVPFSLLSLFGGHGASSLGYVHITGHRSSTQEAEGPPFIEVRCLYSMRIYELQALVFRHPGLIHVDFVIYVLMAL